MVKFINFALLLSTLFTASLSLPVAKSDDVFDLDSTNFTEDYYTIYIDEKSLNKRSEGSSVESAIKDINQIIKDGKKLYKNKKKLEELEEKYEESQLMKRDTSSSDDETGYAFPVYSHGGHTVVYTYLHPGLLEDIDSLPYVDSIEPEAKVEFAGNSSSIDKILKETGWKDLTYEKSNYHLSLLSQDASADDDYDNTYYYPSTAGKDVDIYLFEAGYNFNHLEFRSNKADRTIKCINSNVEGVEVVDESKCQNTDDKYYDFHGEFVSTVAAGRAHGVARKANVYATLIEGASIPFINAALLYIKDNLLRPNKSVFNFSFIVWADLIENPHRPQRTIHEFQDIVNELTEAGAIFVSSSGNNGFPAKYIYRNRHVIPCTFDNVICVGGVANNNSTALVEKKNDKVYYRRTDHSNYGQYVDIYAPYVAEIEYLDRNNKNVKEVIEGTSFAAPIVAGVAATIISERDDITFDHDTMLKYLHEHGQKGVITNIPRDEYNEDYDEALENVFVNNGKHMIVRKD